MCCETTDAAHGVFCALSYDTRFGDVFSAAECGSGHSGIYRILLPDARHSRAERSVNRIASSEEC